MGKMIERTTYSIASCYLTAIVNADYSGLEDDESLESLNKLVEEIGTGTLDYDSDNTHFQRCDVSGLLADCIEVTVYDFKK